MKKTGENKMKKYTRKSAISFNNEISTFLFLNIEKLKNKFDILKTDISEKMFTISIDKRINRGPIKSLKGRKAFKFVDVICINWNDSFYNKKRSIDFYTPKEFNEFINNL